MEPPSESLGPPPSPFTAVASATIGALHRSPFIAFALKQLFKLQAFAPSSLSGQESRIMEELQTPSYNGQTENPDTLLFEDIDSTCSTPYVSAPSSPGRGPISAAGGGFFYSAPASPMHFTITAASTYTHSASSSSEKNSGCDFEFSARFVSSGFTGSGSMSSADELFLNGQIRPMKLSTHLERPQVLAPLLDLEEEGEENEEVEASVRGRDLRLRDKSLRRRTRSLSPLRNTPLEWTENEEKTEKKENVDPSVSSGSGRSSKRWVFLRDFLRSKSEGRSNNKFWSTISFSPAAKDKKPQNQGNGPQKPKKVAGKPTNGIGKKRVPAASPHELHYKANRAQAEELRRKTFLPYRQGLLGCLGFSSKGYGAMSGFARALNPVSSR
uniref:Calmodulin-binding protein n=2 Tax=Glycine max TaxID=3847 RepID=A0A0R0F351_SOYBN